MTSLNTRVAALETSVQNYNIQAEAILAAAGQGSLDPASIAAQIEAATQAAINEVLTTIDGLDVADLLERTEVQAYLFSLQTAYDPANKFILELFTDLYTAKDELTVSGVGTVTGDDSVDVADTSGLVVGQEYYLTDGTSSEFVIVAEIFSEDRFRAHFPLSVSIVDGTLNRSTISVVNDVCTMADGDVYYSVPMNLDLVTYTDKSLIIRTNNPENMSLYYKNTSSQVWTERVWGWMREKDNGYYDLEYTLPISSNFDIRIIANDDVNIKHIVGMSRNSGLGGVHHPPETPSIILPVDGATDIGEQPSITTSAFSHPTGDGLDGTEFQICSDAGFESEDIIDESGLLSSGISYSPNKDVLSVSTTYYVRARHQDEYGGVSEWSTATSFTTASSFVTVTKPTGEAPANGDEIASPDGLTLVSSDFDTEGGTDTHANSQWQVATDPAFGSTVVDSGTDDTNLTIYDVADGTLERDTTYYWRVRHEGTAEGWSDWSNAVVFSVSNFATFITALDGGDNEDFTAVTVDADGNIYAVGRAPDATGYNECQIVKFSSDGDVLWQKKVTGSGSDYFYAVAVDGDGNVYAAGYETSSDPGSQCPLLIKFSSAGAVLWQKRENHAYSCGFRAVAVDGDGNVYAAGYGDLGSGHNDAMVLKFSSAGVVLWQKKFTSSDHVRICAVAVDGDGNVYAAGDEDVTSSNGRLWLAKVSASGSVAWQKKASAGRHEFHAVAVDSSGNIYAAGYDQSSGDSALLMKFSSTGDVLWQKKINSSSGYEALYGVVVDSTDDVFVVGREYSVAGPNPFVGRFNSDGVLVWMRSIVGTHPGFFYGVALNDDGNIYAVGFDASPGSYSYNDCLLASIPANAAGASGTIPDMTELEWQTPELTIGDPGISVAAISLPDSDPGLVFVDSSLPVVTSTLTQIFSNY
jgi:uncharacterized delta-60 repeat protein